MHQKSRLSLLLATAALSLALAPSPARAQAAAPAGSGALVALLPNKCTDLSKWEVKRTPALSGGSSAGKARTWGVFDVAFATRPEWIDELEVEYTVVLFKKDADAAKGEKQYHYFHAAVAYRDVAQGKDHRAGVVLLPQALARWGVPIGFAAQLMVDGSPACEAYHKEAGNLARLANWWTDDRLSGQIAEPHEGYLLDRAKTPFALVEPDSYETSLTASGN